MNTSTKGNLNEPIALTAAEVARLLSVSERHVWSLHSSGRLPRPVRFGRSVRWPYDTLNKWVAFGAPNRDAWERMVEENHSLGV